MLKKQSILDKMGLFSKNEKSPEEKLVKELVGGFLSSDNLLKVLDNHKSQDRLKDIVTESWKNGASAYDIQKVYDENLLRLNEYGRLDSEKRRAKREEEVPKIIFNLKSKPKEEKKGIKKFFLTSMEKEFVEILSKEYLHDLDNEMFFALEGVLHNVRKDQGTLEEIYAVLEKNIDFVEKMDNRLKSAKKNIFGEKICIGEIIFHMPSKYKGRMKSAGKEQEYIIDRKIIDSYELVDFIDDDESFFKKFEHKWVERCGGDASDNHWTQTIGIKVYTYKTTEQVLSDLENSSEKWVINDNFDIGEYSGYKLDKKEGFLNLKETNYFLFEKDGKTVLIFSKDKYEDNRQASGSMKWESIIKEVIS